MRRIDLTYDIKRYEAFKAQTVTAATDGEIIDIQEFNGSDMAFVVSSDGTQEVTFKVFESDNSDMSNPTELNATGDGDKYKNEVVLNTTVKFGALGIKEGSTKRYIRIKATPAGSCIVSSVFEILK